MKHKKGNNMDAQFTWNGATYAVKAATTADDLDIQWLAVELNAERKGRHWLYALNYASFAVRTRVIKGKSTVPIPSVDSPLAEHEKAMKAWLEAEGLLDEWRSARTKTEVRTPEEEQPNPPNGGGTPDSDDDAPNS